MRTFYLLSILTCVIAVQSIKAQEPTEKVLIEDTYLLKINPAGTYATGQDGLGSVTIGYDIANDESVWYPACFPGDGNCVANNGFIVGQEMQVTGMFAALMKDGEIIVTDALKRGGMSMFNAITPDGNRACGYISNTSSSGALFVPFYCDITPDGSLQEPVLLPCPAKDIFGSRPQYIIAGCISDNGKTIVGLVTNATGSFSYPIIFREDEDGNWSYSQPTEKLLNLNGREMPIDPDESPYMQKEPRPEDYMTEEQIEDYHKLQARNPDYDYYWLHMDDDAYKLYYNAHTQWAQDYSDWYYTALEEYQRALNQVGRDQHFGGILLISPDGKTMITANFGIPYSFNLEDDTFGPMELSKSDIILTQILSDGTLVGCSMVGSSPYVGYISLNGSNDFIKVSDYLAENRPSDFQWLEGTILNTGQELITGIPLFSDDMQTIGGGYYDGAGGALSYFFKEAKNNGVEKVELPAEGPYEVYSLQGLKISGINCLNDLLNLPKGIYIVNGKKIAL